MSGSENPSRQLYRAWQDILRANQETARQGPAPARRAGTRADPEPGRFSHSEGLAALIAALKCERLRRGLSLGDVARVTKRARSAISRLENGHYPNPTFDTVFRYAAALGMRIEMVANRESESLGRGSPEGPADGGFERRRPGW